MKAILLSLILATSAFAGEQESLALPTLPDVAKFSFADAASVSTFGFYASDTDEFGAGIHVSYAVNDHVAVRVTYQSSGFEFEQGELGDDLDASLVFSYPFKSSLPFDASVYIITGSSVGSFDSPQIDAIIGAGATVAIRDNLDVFAEYELSSDQLSTVRLGVTVSF